MARKFPRISLNKIGAEDFDDGNGTAPDPELPARVEAAAAEQDAAAQDIDDSVEAIEEAAADQETLEGIADVMDRSVAAGTGIDANAARIAEVAVESICLRLGMDYKPRTGAGMEAFGRSETKLAATKRASEGVKEFAIKIWEGIKAAIKRVWEMVKSFFTGVTKNRESLIQHLKDIRKSLDDVPAGTEMDKKDLEGGFCATLTTGGSDGKLDKGTVIALMDGSGKGVLSVCQKLCEISKTEAKLLLIGARARDGAPSKGDTVKAIAGSLTEVQWVGSGREEKETKYFGGLPNGKSLALQVGATGTGKETIHISVVENIRNLANRIEALDLAGCSEMIDKAIADSKNLKKMDDVYKELQEAYASLNKAIEKLQSVNAAQEKDEDKKSDMREEAARAREVNDYISKAGTALPNMAFQILKAVGDWVSASRSNLKKKD